jgi:hypothetical protein
MKNRIPHPQDVYAYVRFLVIENKATIIDGALTFAAVVTFLALYCVI